MFYFFKIIYLKEKVKASDILKESDDILLICIIKIKIFIYNTSF